MGVPVLRDISGYEGIYQVSNTGEIYSCYTNKYLKPSVTHRGYASVELFKNGKSKRCLIHRLVAQAFIPNPKNYPQINHIDENPSNNCVDNLEWCTAKYNMNYGNGAMTRHSKINYHTPKRLAQAINNVNKMKRPVIKLSRDGKEIARYSSAKEASIVNNISHSHILECCAGKRYKTVGGFVWCYAERA